MIARESPARTGVAAATLLIAAVCWIVTVRQMDSMDMAMRTGLGAFAPFLAFWAVMMGAMMLPSAVPMMSAKPPAAPAVAALYVLVWSAFGATGYAILSVIPWHLSAWLGAIAFALAGAYSLTPLQRGCRDHCRERVARAVYATPCPMRSTVSAAARA